MDTPPQPQSSTTTGSFASLVDAVKVLDEPSTKTRVKLAMEMDGIVPPSTYIRTLHALRVGQPWYSLVQDPFLKDTLDWIWAVTKGMMLPEEEEAM